MHIHKCIHDALDIYEINYQAFTPDPDFYENRAGTRQGKVFV